MPGTHSKWVTMKGSVVTGFESFMTGELFSVVTGKTILRIRPVAKAPSTRATRLLQAVCAMAGHGPN
jgi:2-keto-3-deoxy-galactonokinase